MSNQTETPCQNPNCGCTIVDKSEEQCDTCGEYIEDRTTDMITTRPPESELALDALAGEAVVVELAELERLYNRSTQGEWAEGASGGAVVVKRDPTASDDLPVFRHYGGDPVLESCRLADREFICALHRWAPGLIAIAQGHEAEVKANDMLVRSLIEMSKQLEESKRKSRDLEEVLSRARSHVFYLELARRNVQSANNDLKDKLNQKFSVKVKKLFKRLGRFLTTGSPLPQT